MKPDRIQWEEWGRAVFQRAHRENRLVLLYISATWCHWCHVMEETTLSHPEVVRRIDSDYIPVRVDSDRRPDINNRYNMGGWPTVAILTPQGDLLAGETYLPVGTMIQMLYSVRKGKDGDPPGRPHLKKTGRSNHENGPSQEGTEVKKLNVETIHRIGERLKQSFDPVFGGFRGSAKFPMPSALELTMTLFLRTGEQDWLQMATTTLDAMREGEIHDLIDGGFFRYSTAEDWDQPHYEKMLETQVDLLSNYLMAYQITEDLRYRVTAQEILDYVSTFLLDHQGKGYYGSQTADQDYYQSGEEERNTLTPPPVDETIYTHWNSRMVSGLLKAAVLLDRDDYEVWALQLLDGLIERCIDDQEGAVHYLNEDPPGPSHLIDQCAVIQALLDAYEWTGDERYLEEGRALIDLTLNKFWDAKAGCLRDRFQQEDDPAFMIQDLYPLKENTQMVEVLLRSTLLMEKTNYRDRAEEILSFFLSRFEAYRLHAAPYALAMDKWLHPPTVVTIIAPRMDPKRRSFVRKAMKLSLPFRVVEHLDAEIDAHRIVTRGYPLTGKAVAYVCRDRMCFPVIRQPDDFDRIRQQLYDLKE